MTGIIFDNEMNLKIKNNAFVLGNVDGQNMNDILNSVKGDFKFSPQIGLNADTFNNTSTTEADIKSQVKFQLELDGFRVKDVVISRNNGNLIIVPYAERL